MALSLWYFPLPPMEDFLYGFTHLAVCLGHWWNSMSFSTYEQVLSSGFWHKLNLGHEDMYLPI
jgi:hypothetical protein